MNYRNIVLAAVVAGGLVVTTVAEAISSIRIGRISAYSSYESPGKFMSCGRIRSDAISLSRDLFYKNGKKRCGDQVSLSYTDSSGRTRTITRTVWDTMNSRFSRSADIYFGYDYNSAKTFGIKKGTLRFLN